MTVNPIADTITANSLAMVAGAALPTLTYSSSLSGISYSTPPSCSTTATSASVAGTYPITCANAASTGYAFSYIAGSLIVTAGPQNIWVVNGNASLSKLNNAGSAVSPGTGYGGGSVGIAVDASGNVWSANPSGNSVVVVGNGGVAGGMYSGGGLNAPSAVAVSGGGAIWVVNGNSTLSLLSNNGVLLSPASGFGVGNLSSPSAIAIDNAGNVWVTNAGNNSLTEFLGAADPVVTPLSSAAGAGTLGVKP